MVHATDKSTGYWSRSVLLVARIWIGNKIRKSALGTVERDTGLQGKGKHQNRRDKIKTEQELGSECYTVQLMAKFTNHVIFSCV